jgi:hypothetical protein
MSPHLASYTLNRLLSSAACAVLCSQATPIDPYNSPGAVFDPGAITVVLGLLELFVVVGKDARSRTADITFALQTAAVRPSFGFARAADAH